jgi:SAM-dependent methyltransferase
LLCGVPGAWGFRRCTGADCGVLWLDPTPLDEDLGLAYPANYYTHDGVAAPSRGAIANAIDAIQQGYLANRYGYRVANAWLVRPLGLLIHFFPGRRETLDLLLMKLAANERGRILNVGCGGGRTLELRGLSWETEGVDPALGARRSAGATHGRSRNRCGQHYASSRFNATMSHVIEHVRDPEALLRECLRVLGTGGRLVVSTPNAASLGLERFGAAWFGLDPPRHLHIFTADALARLATRAGFADVRVTSAARIAPVIYRLSATVSPARDRHVERNRAALELGAQAFHVEERVATWFRPHAGEELILEARRSLAMRPHAADAILPEPMGELR